MTTKDYLRFNPEENLSWCKPYVAKDGEFALILNEGEIIALKSPRLGFAVLNTGEPDNVNVINSFLHELKPDCDFNYDPDWISDLLDLMDETGCARCPSFEDCQAFDDDDDDDEEEEP